ncbi:MAG: glycosyltransferase [Halieaceae bacterium]|jgi:glycosyltransferase involved in cell wall biosynthesis|nr:glycosyltransferase [Halieaceae bacterium]
MVISDSIRVNDLGGAFYTPRITALMPVYNAERYLPEALKSILDQSYDNFRLLIVDDASTDSSSAMMQGNSRCVVRYPETHDEIIGRLAVFRRSICHPSVMIRPSLFLRRGKQ